MIKLQTPVNTEKCNVSISFSDKIMMLGSCFSDNIGRQLANYGFDVCINPFGTLYNPISILNSLERLVSGKEFTIEDCIKIGAGDERFCSFFHHTAFERETEEAFLADANNALKTAREHLATCTKLIITLGTSWCFRHNEKDLIVSNCLKRPADEFTRERLTVMEITEALRRIQELAGIPVIYTVSSIRHFKDGAHGNQLSKSALLLGIDNVADGKVADYFPAYEIVMDELRDYRFYAEDMCHPSSQTVDYIRERFLDWALPKEERPQLEENIRSYRRSCHRPLSAE